MSRSPVFPPGYAPWLGSRLPGEIEESSVDCNNCAMVKPEGLTRDPGPFLAHLKCCTYFPFVPNFGLGGMLASPDGGVNRNVRLRLDALKGRGVLLPLGLFPSPETEQKYKSAGDKAFGRRDDLLCPFFDKATHGCSVWMNRPGVCTTYFCKSDRGFSGLEFWQDVEEYLNLFEWTLANEVVSRVGFTEDDLEVSEAVFLEEDAADRSVVAQGAWGSWAGREDEFFLECARRAKEVTPEEVAALMGEDGEALEESLRERMRG